ncbi:hypothetical protein BU26DRAFT_511307 [Trematosphaeria pertusa]|uniref:Uncharacterized protein n=1 Tax=Trematosphaeria pertusa TaxID=390896 RepID=A0A6A6HTL9_9PLEO|nr:uncharacterized protein BU26DRAFT_511307 [Trematosphaeria pertusa]KAF2241515.1 hypothetical protein BU26DRAFT_511307 [Trematosphaeria pertusa]
MDVFCRIQTYLKSWMLATIAVNSSRDLGLPDAICWIPPKCICLTKQPFMRRRSSGAALGELMRCGDLDGPSSRRSEYLRLIWKSYDTCEDYGFSRGFSPVVFLVDVAYGGGLDYAIHVISLNLVTDLCQQRRVSRYDLLSIFIKERSSLKSGRRSGSSSTQGVRWGTLMRTLAHMYFAASVEHGLLQADKGEIDAGGAPLLVLPWQLSWRCQSTST